MSESYQRLRTMRSVRSAEIRDLRYAAASFRPRPSIVRRLVRAHPARSILEKETWSVDQSQRTFTNRRHLLKGGAALSGAAVVAAGLSPHTAMAQEAGQSRLQQVLDRGKLVVGTGSTNPPWHYEDADGQLVGFDIEIAKLLAHGLYELTAEQLANREEWSQRLEFVVEAADARIPNLVADKVDIVCQFMTVYPLRAQQVEFTIPYYREAVTLLFKADSPYTGTADISGQGATIAILENPDAVSMVHNGVADAEVSTFDSVANSVLALDSGRVDATAIDLSTAQYLTTQSPDMYKIGIDSWQPQTYALAVKPGDQRWLNWVNTALHEYLAGAYFSYYQAAFAQHFGVELEPPPAGFPIEYR
jgi:polar amino acid transport system substrate-binding protein